MFDQSRQHESPSDSGASTARDQFILNATFGLNHWWRWIVGVVVILIMWIGVGSIGLGLAGCELLYATNFLGLGCSGGEFTGDGALSAQIVIFGSGFAVGLLGIWLVLKYIHRKRFMGLLTGRATFDCSRLLVGMLAALVALAGPVRCRHIRVPMGHNFPEARLGIRVICAGRGRLRPDSVRL